jgi:putative flippase GtrA
MRFTERETIRFAIAGALNTALGYGVYCAFLLVFPYAAAYTVSYVIGIFLSYVLNTRFVFRTAMSFRTAVQFPLVYVAQYCAGVLLLTVFVSGLSLHPRVAALLVVCCTVPLSFILNRFLLKPQRASAPSEP